MKTTEFTQAPYRSPIYELGTSLHESHEEVTNLREMEIELYAAIPYKFNNTRLDVSVGLKPSSYGRKLKFKITGPPKLTKYTPNF